jgi:hypothetical protein
MKKKNPIKHHKSRFKGKRKKSSGCMNFDPKRKQQYTCDRKSSSAAAQISIMHLMVRT